MPHWPPKIDGYGCVLLVTSILSCFLFYFNSLITPFFLSASPVLPLSFSLPLSAAASGPSPVPLFRISFQKAYLKLPDTALWGSKKNARRAACYLCGSFSIWQAACSSWRAGLDCGVSWGSRETSWRGTEKWRESWADGGRHPTPGTLHSWHEGAERQPWRTERCRWVNCLGLSC